MKRTGSMRSRVGPAVTSTLRPASSPAARDSARRRCKHARNQVVWLQHPAGAGLAAGLVAFAGTEDRDTARTQQIDVGARGGVRPHQAIHGRRDRHRRIGREAERAEQVVGEAVREAADEVGGRRGDQDAIGPAREFDVAHRGLGGLVPEIGAHGPARQRLEGERGDEPAGAGRHHDLHLDPSLAQAADDLGALVCGDPARDAEQDARRNWCVHGRIMGRCGRSRKGAGAAFRRKGLRP